MVGEICPGARSTTLNWIPDPHFIWSQLWGLIVLLGAPGLPRLAHATPGKSLIDLALRPVQPRLHRCSKPFVLVAMLATHYFSQRTAVQTSLELAV